MTNASNESSSSSSPTPTRAIPRQATAAVAHVAPPPDDDDPLLAFAPYLHKQPRRNSITPDLQRQFITTLAATGIVKQAAKSIGKSLEALYKIRHRPGAEGFAAAWDEALAWGVEQLEDCAMERAIHQGMYDLRANSLLCFVLAYRSRHQVDVREIVPGHLTYERIRAEVLADERDERARGAGPDRRNEVGAFLQCPALTLL